MDAGKFYMCCSLAAVKGAIVASCKRAKSAFGCTCIYTTDMLKKKSQNNDKIMESDPRCDDYQGKGCIRISWWKGKKKVGDMPSRWQRLSYLNRLREWSYHIWLSICLLFGCRCNQMRSLPCWKLHISIRLVWFDDLHLVWPFNYKYCHL